MQKGDFIKWVEPSKLPGLLIDPLDKLKEKHGEGPFQITDIIIQTADKVDVEFINKNGEKVILFWRWFEEVL